MKASLVKSFIHGVSNTDGTELETEDPLGDLARVPAGFQAMTPGFRLNLDRNDPALFLALDEVLDARTLGRVACGRLERVARTDTSP